MDSLREVGAIHIRNKPEPQASMAVMLQRLIGHYRTQVRAADAYVDDVADTLAGMTLPRSAPDTFGECCHLVEHLVDAGHYIISVHNNRCSFRGAKSRMKDSPLFSDIDLLSPEHVIYPSPEVRFLSELKEELKRLVDDEVLGIIQMDAGSLSTHPLSSVSVVSEKVPKMKFPDLPAVGFEGLPC